ncbi:MAG: hypothetical protein AB7E13_06010 [Arcobacteraceae bacterium]
MRFGLLVISFVILMFVGTFVVLFTPIGNPIVASIVESKIKEQTGLNAKFQTFALSWGHIDTNLQIDTNSVKIAGNYSLFAKSFDLDYNLALNDLKSFSTLAKKELQGGFNLGGKIKGDLNNTKIIGSSDIASSTTNFDIDLVKFNPNMIVANIKNAHIKELLAMAGEKHYADGLLNLDMLIKDFKPDSLDGLVKLIISNGKINTVVMKNDFDIELPTTDFTLTANALLQKNIDYDLNFASNLAKITTDGTITSQTMFIDGKYNINISELGLLTPIIKYPLKGALNAKGDIKGDKENLDVSVLSDLARSDTNLKINLKNYALNNINGTIKELNTQSLLNMTSQPVYANALVDMQLQINSAKIGALNGNIVTKVKNGTFVPKTFKEAFDINMPQTNKFNSTINTNLDKSQIKSKIDFISNIADININDNIFDLGDSSLKSDFKVKVSDLNNLYFLTERKLVGNIELNGDIYKKEQDLKLNMKSNTLGGNVSANLVNEKLKVDLKSLEIAQLLKMLDYDQFFKGKLNGDINYNTLDKAGIVNADFAGGHFAKNNFTTLVAGLTGVNILNETFSKANLQSQINKNIIDTDLNMSSDLIDIKTKNALLDTDKQTINALLEVQTAKMPIKVKLTGQSSSPNISVEGGKIIEEKAKKEIDRAVEKHLGEEGKNLLKGLFR